MASGETINDVIRRIINILDAASVPYMLTGSFASSFHGMPRATLAALNSIAAPKPTFGGKPYSSPHPKMC
jgi:hypothetical protein